MALIEDKRTERTKNAIRNTFLVLLEHKELEEITVSEIANTACFNRSTVYRYYHDIYELVEECIELYLGMNDRTVPLRTDIDFYCQLRNNIRIGYQRIFEHRRLFLVGMSCQNKRLFPVYFENLTMQNKEHYLQVFGQLEITESSCKLPLDLLASIGEAIITTVAYQWAAKDCISTLDEVANQASEAYVGFILAMRA